MPTVPQQAGPQVQQAALPAVRQSGNAPPPPGGIVAQQQAQAGQTLSALGGQGMNFAIQMQERENADMLFRAEASLQNDYMKFHQDITNRRGQNAWGVTAEADKWFADQSKTYSENLGNDTQRSLFSQSLEKMRQAALSSISNYESDQRRASLEESAKASIAGSINQAAALAGQSDFDFKPVLKNEDGSYSTERTITVEENGRYLVIPTIVNGKQLSEDEAIKAFNSGKNQAVGSFDSLPAAEAYAEKRSSLGGGNPIYRIKSDIEKRIQVQANLNGWSPERTAFEREQYMTTLHKQVIQGVLAKDPEKAQEYYDVNKGEIAGSERDVIEGWLKEGALRKTAQGAVEKVVSKRLPLDDALDYVRRHYSGGIEDEIIRRLKVRYDEAKVTKDALQKQNEDTAWKIVVEGGSRDYIPPQVWNSLSGKEQKAIVDYTRQRASGKDVKTDFEVYQDVRRMIIAGAPVDLKKYTLRISTSDLQELDKLQNGSKAEKLDAATLQQQLTVMHNSLDWGAGEKDKQGAFDRAVYDAVTAEQEKTGKKLSYDERQTIIDRMIIEGDINGPWYLGGVGGGRRWYQVQGTSEAAGFVPSIPDSDKQAITERFRMKVGRNPDDKEMAQIYKSWKGLP